MSEKPDGLAAFVEITVYQVLDTEQHLETPDKISALTSAETTCWGIPDRCKGAFCELVVLLLQSMNGKPDMADRIEKLKELAKEGQVTEKTTLGETLPKTEDNSNWMDDPMDSPPKGEI